MRDIKFRAYDTKSKVWRYWDIRKDCMCDLLIYGFLEHITQWTGLKDKNGTEIYDGDVLVGLTYEGGKYVHKTGAINYDSDCGRWMLGTQTLGSFTQDKKVIGNIYENPGLLE